MKRADLDRLPRRRDDARGADGGGRGRRSSIPLPTATDDHQRKNAEVLVDGRRGGDDRADAS